MKINFNMLVAIVYLFVSTISWANGPEGIYVFGSTNNMASGIVYIHKTGESMYLFYFEYNSGEPAYNSNAQYGNIRILEKMTFENHWDKIENRIEFVFDPDFSSVTLYGQLRGMVSYNKTSQENPDFFINRKGEKIFFRKTKPEAYME